MYRLAWTLRAFCSRCRSKTHGLGKNRGFRPQLEVRCEEIRRGSVLVAGRICFLSFMGSMGSQRRDSTQRFGYRHRSAEPQCTSTSVLRVSHGNPAGSTKMRLCCRRLFCTLLFAARGFWDRAIRCTCCFARVVFSLEMFEVHEFSNLFQASLAT